MTYETCSTLFNAWVIMRDGSSCRRIFVKHDNRLALSINAAGATLWTSGSEMIRGMRVDTAEDFWFWSGWYIAGPIFFFDSNVFFQGHELMKISKIDFPQPAEIYTTIQSFTIRTWARFFERIETENKIHVVLILLVYIHIFVSILAIYILTSLSDMRNIDAREVGKFSVASSHIEKGSSKNLNLARFWVEWLQAVPLLRSADTITKSH